MKKNSGNLKKNENAKKKKERRRDLERKLRPRQRKESLTGKISSSMASWIWGRK